MRQRFFSVLCAFALVLSASAAEQVIKLSAPNLQRTATLMQSLRQRQSVREFSPRALSQADLSDLLWAANGINRAESGKRTAPSAMNRQEVDIYVLFPEGAYLYDASRSELTLVVAEDLRSMVAGRQTSVKEAPLCLLLVSNGEKFQGRGGERDLIMRGVDVGIVSQNISLFCAAAGLATVPRGSMELEQLRQALGLSSDQVPMLNHPVGYPK